MYKLRQLTEYKKLEDIVGQYYPGKQEPVVSDGDVTPKPRADGEKQFVKLHKTEKSVLGREGNDSKLYNASNIKQHLDRTNNAGASPFPNEEIEEYLEYLGSLDEDMIDEELEQLDEISKKTLGSYIRKATDSQFDSETKFGEGRPGFLKKASRRREGIKRASDRFSGYMGVRSKNSKWLHSRKYTGK